MENTYDKNKGSAGQKGIQFQLDLSTVCLLNALDHHKDWKISCENKNAGKYDDIVIELAGEAAVLVQAKHKQNRKINKEQLLSHNSKNTDFSLPKYFFSYEEIKNKFRRRTVIICTNTTIYTNGLENALTSQRASPDSVLHYRSDTCSYYTFNESILPELKRNAEIYFSKNLRDKSIDETVITDENLKDFLKNLQIFSSYPCEDHLHKIIEQLLCHSNLSSLCCKISAQEILRKVEDWFKQPKGEYLTEMRVKAMLCEIRSDKYCESLKNYNLSFEQNDFSFADSNRIFHVKVDEGYLLQVLKIYHALQGLKGRKLFVNPDDGPDVRKHVIDAFELQRYTFLVITCNKITQETVTREVSDKLKGILDKYKYKKVILASKGDSKLMGQIELERIFEFGGSVTFEDFSKVCQERLLDSKNVIFQGNTVSLKELLHTQALKVYTKSFDSAMLEKLIRGEKVKVGVQPSDLDEDIAWYYVSRTFERQVDETGKTGDALSEESIFNVHEKVVIISDSAGMGKSTVLTKLSMTIKESNSHLWVIKMNLNDYTNILRDTLRKNRNVISVTELLNSREATRLTNQFEELVFSMNEKVVLMLDGMDEISPDYTDLVLDLLHQCQHGPNFAKIFVTTRPHVALELKIVLGIGSFRLVPFTRSDQVNFLTNYWTRNLNLKYSSKRKCEQYAVILIDKISFWIRSNYPSENPFEEIPLQVRMVAEIFQENIRWRESTDWEGCKEYLSGDKAEPKLPQKFNIARLYDAFIEKKKDVFMDKANTSGNTAANQAFLNHFKGCLAYHHNLALKVILNETESLLFPNCHSSDKNMEVYVLKIGIVHKLADEFHFVHRSFAEYFVADSIVQELQRQNPNVAFQRFLIDVVLLNDRFQVVRAFLDILLQKVALPPNTFKNYRCHTSKTDLNLIFKLADEGYVAILQLILKSINFKIVTGKTVDVKEWRPKVTFKKRNTLNDLKILVRKAGVNIKYDSGYSPLHLAAKRGHWEMVKFLVELGANVNFRDSDNKTPLYVAAKYRRWDTVRYLAEHGADVNVSNSDDITALHLAAEYGNLDTVLCLVEHGADVNVKDNNGNTALYLAVDSEINQDDALHLDVECDRLNVVRYLLEHGVVVNIRNNNANTALHQAAKCRVWDTVKHLVERGAKINVKDNDGYTALHLAAEYGRLDTVTYLATQGTHLNTATNKGSTPLHLAASCGRLDTVRYLAEHGTDVNAKDNDGKTSLHLAAEHGNLDVVEYLAAQRANLNVEDSDVSTILQLAAKYREGDTVKCLVERGADINARSNDGSTALHLISGYDRLSTVTYLVEHGADVNVKDNDGNTPIHLAAKCGRLDTVKYLITRGSHLNACTNKNSTPLHLGTKYGRWDTVRYLVEHGTGVNVKDNDGKTSLHLAAEYGRLDIVKYLIAQGAHLNDGTNDGKTVLHLAAKHQKWDAVKCLVEHGVNINVKDYDGNTILHLAADCDKLDVVKYVVEHGANINVRANDGSAALHLVAGYNRLNTGKCDTSQRSAAEYDRLNTADYLMEHGADINVKDNDGNTVLHLAAEFGRLDTVKYLLAQGATVDVRNNNGWTVLHLSAGYDRLNAVKCFVEHGADVNAKDNDDNTALHLAVKYGGLDTVHYLVKQGATVNGRNNKGWTALHLAAECDKLNAVKYLVKKDAQLNVTNNGGKTALYLAVGRGRLDTVKYLVEHGADLNVRTKSDDTALHLAVNCGRPDLVKYLVENGADINVRAADGTTALSLAVKHSYTRIVKYLVDQGAGHH
ncbi:uncharacterized protein LOC108909819 [Anoplophora glabripennis]|uniref:uncharacterized protein LOC108909819 n=1 Tax=Anoplophora glabripennis TaxID=217634 RepID=UPI000874273B|nr:uncharacterized protein LOC108909819 [Anoplophora glabripennis]